MTVRTRNKMQDQMGEITLNNLRTSKIKWLLFNKFNKEVTDLSIFLLNFVHPL